jgi:hypothetical protein
MAESSVAADSAEDSSLPVASSSEEDTPVRDVSPLTPVSLLDKLRTPKRSDISRKRKVCTNPPPVGKRRSTSRSLSDLKSVTASQRVREFPNESLAVSCGKLFCLACREDLSLKLSVITNHIKSGKHSQGKEKLNVKEARERDIADALKTHNVATHLEGETLPMDQQVYRVKVVSAFLRAGVPLNKVILFRDGLEENAFRLTDRSHMSNLIPFIWKEEEKRIKNEIEGRMRSKEGTYRLCLMEPPAWERQ